jgi:tetratricopeptide (TPR) repeat protein
MKIHSRHVVPLLVVLLLIVQGAGGEEPISAVRAIERGNSALEEGDLDAAASAFEGALRIDPKSAKALYGRACVHNARGEFDQAIADYTEAIRLDSKWSKAYAGRGNVLAKKGETQKSLADCNEALRLDPKEPTAFIARAQLYLRTGSLKLALADCNEAIRLDPQRADGYKIRGYLNAQKGQPAKAIADYSEAIRLKPKDPVAHLSRGMLYHQTGDLEKAVADYSTAVALNPRDAQAYSARAYLHAQMGDSKKAMADYCEAIRLNPRHVVALCGRGSLWHAQGDLQAAVADYSEAIRLDPKTCAAYVNRTGVYRQQGKLKEAIADLDELIRLNPESPLYFELRATLWINQSDYDRAIADLRTVFRLNPKDPAAKFEDWPKASLTAEDLKHGQAQVAQMLRDRPAMGKYGEKETDTLLQWAGRKFAGEDLRQRITWDASAPSPETESDCRSPTTWRRGSIRLHGSYPAGPNQGKERSFDEMWSNAVFELYNISNAEPLRRLQAAAAARKISREDLISGIIKLEARAADKQRAFYVCVFLPWAKEHHLASDPQRWRLGQRSDLSSDSTLLVTDRHSAYWQNYARSYDFLVLHSLVEEGESDGAIELAGKLATRVKVTEEKIDIHHARGEAYVQKEEWDKAIADFTEAIRLDPEDAQYWCFRGRAYQRKGELDSAIADYSEAARLTPKDIHPYLYRYSAHEKKGEVEKAIGDLDAAIAIDPRCAVCYEARGMLRLAHGGPAQGIADLRAALQYYPEHVGAKFEPWHKAKVAASDLEYGEEQVQQLLRDRPAMAKFGEDAAPLRQWAARKFAGEDLGQRIRWDASDPVAGTLLQNQLPGRLTARLIRMRLKDEAGPNKPRERSFEELWSDAVFALYSIAGARDFDKLVDATGKGWRSKGEFIAQAIAAESPAADKRRAFYIHLFLPWATEHRLATNPQQWRIGQRAELDAFNRNDPHCQELAREYDAIVLRGISDAVRGGSRQRVLRLADACKTAAKTDRDKWKVNVALGTAYFWAHDLDRAIVHYTEAIRLDPRDASIYLKRGWLYQQQKVVDKALADFSQAIRLDPRDAITFYRRGGIYLDQKVFDKALADFNEGIRLDPKSATLRYARACVYANRDDKDDSEKVIADCTEAVRLNPKFTEAYYERGVKWAEKHEQDKAIADYNQAIQLNPAMAEVYHERGLVYQEKGDKAQAELDFAQAKRLGYKEKK